jgi:hypothetical protein
VTLYKKNISVKYAADVKKVADKKTCNGIWKISCQRKHVIHAAS